MTNAPVRDSLALGLPGSVQLEWNMVGGDGWAKVLVSEYIQPEAGARILEIGCEPGTIPCGAFYVDAEKDLRLIFLTNNFLLLP